MIFRAAENRESYFLRLLATGLFRWVPIDKQPYAQRGDIYLNEGCHTATCTSDEPDVLCQFSISENGTIYGAQGDQTGNDANHLNGGLIQWTNNVRPPVGMV